jgi:hypothetical protein
VVSRQGAAHRVTDQGGFLYLLCANSFIGELWQRDGFQIRLSEGSIPSAGAFQTIIDNFTVEQVFTRPW